MFRSIDPAFVGVKDKPDGIYIWRIENMKVVPLDRKQYGHFHHGDSYIVLLKKSKPSNELNVHFWLGEETTQDEAGAAAIKTVELDDCLGGFPVQFREVDGNESPKFMSYFKSGVRYEKGGVKSGFRKVEKEKDCQLLQIKGARHARVSPVELSSKSMNEGDCFILLLGDKIYVWFGKNANKQEKRKAIEIAISIRDFDKAGRGDITHIESFSYDENSTEYREFFGCVGSVDNIQPAEKGGDDKKAEKRRASLYRISDAGADGRSADGKPPGSRVVMSKVADAPLKHSMLDSKDCFMVDTGPDAVFAWVGKQASRAERNSAMSKAEGFVQTKQYPSSTQIIRVIDGGEITTFKAAFESWPYEIPDACMMHGKSASRRSKEVKKFNMSSMYQQAQRPVEVMPDDALGEVQVWRVEDFELAEWPFSRYGIFFQGDSYVILYKYKKSRRQSREQYIIYFWLGLDSTQDEQGAAALLSAKLDDRYDGMPVQIRVVQGKENEHFLRIFKGKMIVKRGGRSKGAKTLTEAEEQGGKVHLYRVRGTNDFNVHCYEVELKAASLNSNDAFVLEKSNGSIVWSGKRASGDEREFAKNATTMISDVTKSYQLVVEGTEPEAFWNALGGKTEYSTEKIEEQKIESRPPRLFHCSNDKGYFYSEEIFDFTQEDLEEDDVMILDTFSDVFLWVGKDSNTEERQRGLLTVQEYVGHDPSRDSTTVRQIVVKQGYEPLNFTGWFPDWSDDKWRQGKTYNELKKELGGDLTQSVAEKLTIYSKKYKYEELTDSNNLPEGVDATKREMYLTEEDFQRVFEMSLDAFNSQPKWKQNNIKKGKCLF